jgi:Phasin protein
MPTIHEEKSAKARQRNRKADRSKAKAKNEPKMEVRSESDAVGSVADAVNSIEAPIEVAVVEAAPTAISLEPAPGVIPEIALHGEVLPPVVRAHVAPPTVGLQAVAQAQAIAQDIAHAYGDYTRKSWATNRFLVERMITVRSFDEAVAIQGEFTRQACANFAVESQKICTLYGEWAQQFVRPLEKFATQWPRIGR